MNSSTMNTFSSTTISYPPTEQKNMEINTNIYNRNIPDVPIDTVYSILSLPTRGTVFPISTIQTVQTSQLPLSSFSTYSSSPISFENSFRPYQCNAPAIEYMKNVPLENSLRNQYFALQKSSMPVYVPSSASDLYNVPRFSVPPPPASVPSTQIPSFLQQYNIGNMVFNNATKVQTRMNIWGFENQSLSKSKEQETKEAQNRTRGQTA